MSKKEVVYEIIDPNSREQLEELLKRVTMEKLRSLQIESQPER